jgi:hypothetical protein
LHEVSSPQRDDRNRVGHLLRADRVAGTFDDKDVHARVDQLGSQVGDTVDPITERPLLHDEVPSVDPTKLPQPLGQQGPLAGRGRRRPGSDETVPVDLPVCCASAASGASARLTARATASPIRRMGTSVGMAGGSLADRP